MKVIRTPKIQFSREWKILCVEDNPHNMEFATAIIKNHGGLVDEAKDGLEAIELCAKNKYDKILMDLTLPNLDGFEATQHIKQTEGPNQKTPILALTADLAEQTQIRCRSLGFAEYLTKPITSKVLFQAIERNYAI